jgi:hypothetical protein
MKESELNTIESCRSFAYTILEYCKEAKDSKEALEKLKEIKNLKMLFQN